MPGIPQRWRRTYPTIVASLVMLVMASMAPVITLGATPEPSPVAIDGLPAYSIDADLTTTNRTIAGTLSLVWTNRTGEPQPALPFRVYPNAAYYGDAETVIEAVTIDDEAVAFALADDPTVLEVTAAAPIGTGETVTIAMTFSTLIAENTGGSFGVFQHDTASGIWNLANWYPILAGWEPGVGWYLAPPTAFGDPTFAETATYHVAVSLPDDLALVHSGDVTATQLGMLGFREEIIETGPAREFAMTALPGAIATHEAPAGDVTVRVSLPETTAIPGLGDFMAETAAAALTTYEGWMGDYTSDELDLTVANLAGASGVSWSGMTWFGLDQIVRDGELAADEERGLAFVILHEVAHQWIADAVGSNNNDHGFFSEGLVQALAVLAADEIFGDATADLYLQAWVAGPYGSLLNDGRDGIADAPLTEDTNGTIRSLLVYGKAGVGFVAIRNEIGETAFLAAMAAFTADYRFAIAAPEDLEAAFDAACACEVRDTWSFWFEEDTATRPDLDAVVTAYVDG